MKHHFPGKAATTQLDQNSRRIVAAQYGAQVTAMTHPMLHLQRTIGNQAVNQLLQARTLQAKLTISQPGDVYEQEADRVADQVMRMSDPSIQRTCAPCAAGGSLCPQCAEEKNLKIQRTANSPGTATGHDMPDDFGRDLGPGQPLDPSTRAFFEPRFGADFSQVRVHMGSQAVASAQSVNALAYTVGRDVVFGAGQFAPQSGQGRHLLAHELTHVIQQGGATSISNTKLNFGKDGHLAERGVNQMTMGTEDSTTKQQSAKTSILGTKIDNSIGQVALESVQRQFITPLGPGGGFGGLLDRDRNAVMEPPTHSAIASPSATGGATSSVQVCARELQGVLGYVGNHAYIDAPPFRYAIIGPLCPASRWENPVTGTTAQKWDNSPDPCRKTPHCVECLPAPGVTDVGACLRAAFTAYNSLSLYRGLGPNSNTFAGTLARTCCAGMLPKPAALGTVPGWDDPPAPARAGATPCPPGPTC